MLLRIPGQSRPQARISSENALAQAECVVGRIVRSARQLRSAVVSITNFSVCRSYTRRLEDPAARPAVEEGRPRVGQAVLQRTAPRHRLMRAHHARARVQRDLPGPPTPCVRPGPENGPCWGTHLAVHGATAAGGEREDVEVVRAELEEVPQEVVRLAGGRDVVP